MPQSTKHAKTQPHFHGGAPEGRRRGIEEGGREAVNEALDDGTLRGVGDNDENVPRFDHSSKGALGRGGGSQGDRPELRPLEDGELRGVDEDGQINQGTHGGPTKPGGGRGGTS
jgi:hypothetical protein